MNKQGSCLEKQKEQCQVHAGEEDHARMDNISTWTEVHRTPRGSQSE